MAAPNSQRGLFWPNFPQPGAQKWSLFCLKKKPLARSKSHFPCTSPPAPLSASLSRVGYLVPYADPLPSLLHPPSWLGLGLGLGLGHFCPLFTPPLFPFAEGIFVSDPQMGAFFGCSYFSVLARRAFFGRFIEFWRKKQFIL